MSDHIPFEIQSEIMNRLPVKSLIRFRSVCKPWKSLIESSGFVAHYSSQQQHLLVRSKSLDDSKDEYVSVIDDDSFPQHRVCVTVPPLVNNLENPVLSGGSHGLLCFQRIDLTGTRAVIWNPSIRKAVAVSVPHVTDRDPYRTALGFGVCRETMDPKIVTITRSKRVKPWKVEVFTLTTRAWRSPYSGNLPRESIDYFESQPVVVDGCLYWLALARDGTFASSFLIISFDITTEDFVEVNLPHSLAYPSYGLYMYKLRESLVVVEDGFEGNKLVYHVWMMEDGVPKSFKQLYTISSHSLDVSLIWKCGFRKTGEALVEVFLRAHPGSPGILAVYDPYSKSISNLGINGRKVFYNYVYSYMETLLLL